MLTAHQARDLGEGLRRLRQRKRLTRYQAAELSGLPHLVYARLEVGLLADEAAEDALMRAWGAMQVYRAVGAGARRASATAPATPLRVRPAPVI